jgi:hypothetical protein
MAGNAGSPFAQQQQKQPPPPPDHPRVHLWRLLVRFVRWLHLRFYPRYNLLYARACVDCDFAQLGSPLVHTCCVVLCRVVLCVVCGVCVCVVTYIRQVQDDPLSVVRVRGGQHRAVGDLHSGRHGRPSALVGRRRRTHPRYAPEQLLRILRNVCGAACRAWRKLTCAVLRVFVLCVTPRSLAGHGWHQALRVLVRR